MCTYKNSKEVDTVTNTKIFDKNLIKVYLWSQYVLGASPDSSKRQSISCWVLNIEHQVSILESLGETLEISISIELGTTELH